MRDTLTHPVTCPTCGHVTHQATYKLTCDNCGKEIDEEKVIPLKIQWFHHIPGDTEVTDYDFDKWACAREWLLKNKDRLLKKAKVDDFITVEYISLKQGQREQHYAGDFKTFLSEFMGVKE